MGYCEQGTKKKDLCVLSRPNKSGRKMQNTGGKTRVIIANVVNFASACKYLTSDPHFFDLSSAVF